MRWKNKTQLIFSVKVLSNVSNTISKVPNFSLGETYVKFKMAAKYVSMYKHDKYGLKGLENSPSKTLNVRNYKWKRALWVRADPYLSRLF